MEKNSQVDSGSRQDEDSPQNVANEEIPRQIIPQKGEEYLRESANIEDMPSPAEDQEARDRLKPEGENERIKEQERKPERDVPGAL